MTNVNREIRLPIHVSKCGRYCADKCNYRCQSEPDRAEACGLEVCDESEAERLRYNHHAALWGRTAFCLAAEVESPDTKCDVCGTKKGIYRCEKCQTNIGIEACHVCAVKAEQSPWTAVEKRLPEVDKEVEAAIIQHLVFNGECWVVKNEPGVVPYELRQISIWRNPPEVSE